MPRVREITRTADLDALEPLWDRLLSETREGGFDRSFGCFRAFAKHDPTVAGLRVLVIEHHDEPLGIVPLVRSRGRGNGSAVTLGWGPHGFGLLGGPVGRDQAVCLSTAVAHLARGKRDWDVLELDEPATADGVPLRRVYAAMKLARLTFRDTGRPAVHALSTATRWVDVVGAAETETRLGFFRMCYDAGPEASLADFGFEHSRTAPGRLPDRLVEEAVARVANGRGRLVNAILEAAADAGHAVDAALMRVDGDVAAAHVGFVEGDSLRSLGGAVSPSLGETHRLEFVRRLVEDSRERGQTEISWPATASHPCEGWEQRVGHRLARRHYARLRLRGQFRRLTDAAAAGFGGRATARSESAGGLRVVG